MMISVVIPALNEQKLLPECLDSLRKQDYAGEYEIILADNGSTDRTVEIARSLGAKIVACSSKRGVSFARQSGADAARGDIIAQADADTIYPPSWLSKISGWFTAHPEAVAVTGRFAYRDPPWWWPVEYYARHLINRLTGKLSGRPALVSGATFAFRKRAFFAAGGYRGMTYAPDQFGLAERLSRLGKVQYDSKLRILTSSRTVHKPLFIILKDVLVHLSRLIIHLNERGLPAARPGPARLSRRLAARLLPVPLVMILLVGAHGVIVPSSQVFGQVYYEAEVSQKVVALTFDGGLDEQYMSAIMDTLDRYGVKATFFLSGEEVELSPEIARRIVSEGDVIGNQSYYHDTLHILSQDTSGELLAAQDVIFKAVGVYPHLYRPPHGTKTPWELENAAELGMIPVTWGAAIDENTPAAEIGEIADEIEPGEIIRLHDETDHASLEAASDGYPLAQLLPQVIEELRARGYRFVLVPELLGVPAYNQPVLNEP